MNISELRARANGPAPEQCDWCKNKPVWLNPRSLSWLCEDCKKIALRGEELDQNGADGLSYAYLEVEYDALRAENASLREELDQARAALVAIREWLWSGVLDPKQKPGAPILAPSEVGEIVNAALDRTPDPSRE